MKTQISEYVKFLKDAIETLEDFDDKDIPDGISMEYSNNHVLVKVEVSPKQE